MFTGAGIYVEGGILNGDYLTVSNAETGVVSDYATVILNDFTSTDNTNGLYSVGSMSLPDYYRSASLEYGQFYPFYMDYTMYLVWNGFYYPFQQHDWSTKTIDLSAYIGETDFLQPSLRMTYDGSYESPIMTGLAPFVELDNLQIVMQDTSGNQWIVDDSSDVGYYPYSANDPASGTSAATYTGGVGGIPYWDCSYSAISASPYNSFWYSRS